MKLNKILRAIFYLIIAIQAIILLSLPLIQMMNDSGWYYMLVHFVNTGNYVTESMYPSFDEPSQLYSFFGYGFFLYLLKGLSAISGIDFSFMVKTFQFIMYITSALLVRNIFNLITNNIKMAYVMGIIFLLYYPYFNFTNLVMSETYATFLILLTVYLFAKNQYNFNKMTTAVMFLLAGYMILVKPVLLPVSVAIVVLFTLNILANKQYIHLLLLIPIFIFPVAQSIFSKAHYDNYKHQSGFGWHMWNRVIFYDQMIPESSENLEKLKQIYESHNKSLTHYGYWWDVTKDLSEFGYKETETQEICKAIAMDAIAEKPFTYIGNTFKNCYTNFLIVHRNVKVFKDLDGYLDKIEEFSHEQQHKPLTDELIKQSYYHAFWFNKQIISFNYAYAGVMDNFNYLFHNIIVLLLFLLAGIHTVYLLLVSRFKKQQIEFLIWFTAFAIIFGSNIAEYPQVRLMQPAVICIVMIIGLKFKELYYSNRNK